MNKILLIGRTTSTCELKTTQNNTFVTTFTLAVDRKFKDASGNKQTDFIPCVAWRQQAEFLNKYIPKGSLIAVEGTLTTRSYQAQDGTNKKIFEVVVDNTQPLEKRDNTEGFDSGADIQQPTTENVDVGVNTDEFDPFAE